MDEDNIITLNDENGNEVEFEFLDLIPYRQNEYVVLLPIGDSDGQVVILQLKRICVRDCLCSVQRAKQRFLYI